MQDADEAGWIGDSSGSMGGDLRHASHQPAVYAIRNGDSRVGTFVLHKTAFRPGDVVLGNFDFTGATVRCLQVRCRKHHAL